MSLVWPMVVVTVLVLGLAVVYQLLNRYLAHLETAAVDRKEMEALRRGMEEAKGDARKAKEGVAALLSQAKRPGF